MELPLSAQPRSLCLLRLSAIGDITHVVPVVKTLQQQWPDCKITWIIGKLEATLVDDLPGVEFIIFDKSAGIKSLLNIRRQLRHRQFDILLHMQVALRASLISLAVNAPLKLGFDRARAHDYQWLFTNCKIDTIAQQHVMDGFFAFLEKLGIREKVLQWDIPIPGDAKNSIDRYISADARVLVINPCSSNRLRNWRNWPSEHYATIADYAIERHNLQVILSGGTSEIEHNIAQKVCRLSQHKIINLVGKTSLKQLLALLQRAEALIAPDTGPAHMATAVNTPVIGLFASSNPQRTGPYLSQPWIVNRYPDAAEKYLHKPVAELSWGQRIRNPEVMSLITVEDVTQKLDRLLSR